MFTNMTKLEKISELIEKGELLQLGKYAIKKSPFSFHGIWVERSISGEGTEMPASVIDDAIDEWYKKHF